MFIHQNRMNRYNKTAITNRTLDAVICSIFNCALERGTGCLMAPIVEAVLAA